MFWAMLPWGCDPISLPHLLKVLSLCQHRHRNLSEQLCVPLQAPESPEALMLSTSPVIKTALPPEVSRAGWERWLLDILSCPESHWLAFPPAVMGGLARGHTQSRHNSCSTLLSKCGKTAILSSVNFPFFKSNTHSPVEIIPLCWIIPIRYKHLYEANAKSNQINFSTHIPSTPAALVLFTVSSSPFLRAWNPAKEILSSSLPEKQLLSKATSDHTKLNPMANS